MKAKILEKLRVTITWKIIIGTLMIMIPAMVFFYNTGFKVLVLGTVIGVWVGVAIFLVIRGLQDNEENE